MGSIEIPVQDTAAITIPIQDNGETFTLNIAESTPINITFSESISVWSRDNTNNTAFLNILGVKVAEIDVDGNMFIKGRYLTY